MLSPTFEFDCLSYYERTRMTVSNLLQPTLLSLFDHYYGGDKNCVCYVDLDYTLGLLFQPATPIHMRSTIKTTTKDKTLVAEQQRF